MKKINVFLIISMMLCSILIFPNFTENSSAITQHETNSGTVTGEIDERITYENYTATANSYYTAHGGIYPYQTFNATSSHIINCIEIRVFKLGTSIGMVNASIRATDVNHKPTGATLTSGDIDGDTFVSSSSGRWEEIQLTSYTLTSGTEYAIILKAPDCDVENRPGWRLRNPGTYTDGIGGHSSTGGASWIVDAWDALFRVKIISTFNVTRTVYPEVESNNFSFVPSNNWSINATLKIPVSTSVRGIVDVTNNTCGSTAIEVNASDEIINNTFWYDSSNQFIYIGTIKLATSTTVNWTINCSYGATFNLIIPSYLEVGQYFESEGFIEDSDGDAISGMIAETRLLYANGTDALAVNPKHNCTGGNYDCRFSTSTLLPGTYRVSIEFTDPTSGIVFKEGATLYLSVDPGSGIHVSTFLHFAFYNNNTGIGIPSESFKIYASTDTLIDSTDRIYVDLYGVYTGQTIYYRIDDYFDNQIYPSSGSYETLSITSTNQFEDVPIDWHSFSVKNMNHSIVEFKMTNGSRTYSQYLYPYEPFYWNVLDGEYTINLTYYNPETDAIESYSEENITISDDTYYWIRGYDLQDIIIEIQVTNSSLNSIVLNIETNVGIVNSTVDAITTTIIADISVFESNITNFVSNVWNQLNITDSVIDYLNTTVNVNILRVNTTINYINDTVWRNFTLLNQTINSTHISIITNIDLSEQNLTSLQLDVWTSFNLTDAVVDWINNTIWSEFTFVNTTINTIDNKLTIDFDMLNVTVDYLNNTVWTEFTAIDSTINSVTTNIINNVELFETNITSLNNNIWNSINITDSIATYLNNTLHNEISAVNVTLDHLNNTIWTNLSLIESDIDTLSVSVHTNLELSETNVSNVIYNVWSSLNISNATIDHLNASIWNEIDIIQSNLNNTNLTITNMILLMENNITSLIITIDNIIDYALMPDVIVYSRNPPIVFSTFDRIGMMLGQNFYKICPPVNVIAQTRQETTGNWINCTLLAPSNGTTENGTITIVEDIVYFSVVNGTAPTWVNITYMDNGTLIQNTTYMPTKFYPESYDISINASTDIYISRETRFNQLKKFYWDVYPSTDNPGWITEANGKKRTGYHNAGFEIENTMDTIWYEVYVYAGLSPDSSPDLSTIRVKDVDNNNAILDEGENYKGGTGIEFKITGSIVASEIRSFLVEYYATIPDQYYYGNDVIHIDAYQEHKRHNEKLYNYFEYTWINTHDKTYRGSLSFYFDFEVLTGIKQDDIIVFDASANQNITDFLIGDQFLIIGANAVGDITSGGGKTYNVYFKFDEYPGQNVEDLHVDTPLTNIGGIPISFFIIFVAIGLVLMLFGILLYAFREKKKYKEYGKGLVGLGLLIAVITWVLSALGV